MVLYLRLCLNVQLSGPRALKAGDADKATLHLMALRKYVNAGGRFCQYRWWVKVYRHSFRGLSLISVRFGYSADAICLLY